MNSLKTIFIGLNNSGKTSIIRFLEEKLDYSTSMTPTRQIEITTQQISLLGVEVKHWDFGGQKAFREKYLLDSERVFAGSRFVIFIIDVQDQEKYNEAIDYLQEVYKHIKLVEDDPQFFILFHKFDPYLDNKKFFEKKIDTLENLIRTIIPISKISFHKTSIFNKLSLIRTFSYVSQFYSNKPEKIKQILKEYCLKTFSKAAILFDRRNFILDFGEDAHEATTYVLELIGNIYLEGIERLEEYKLETLEILSTLQYIDSESDRVNIYFQKLDLEQKLYLVTMSVDPKTKFLAYDNMQNITSKLLELLSS